MKSINNQVHHSNRTFLIAGLLSAALLTACGPSGQSTSDGTSQGASTGPAPSFSLAWSEYPSWSVFGVADEFGLIDGDKGAQGPIEEKWGVDIDLQEADYDTCITMFAAGQADAACLTNMDSLNPASTLPSALVLPTSTSFGADACIVVNSIGSVTDLKGKKVYGLEKTVSEYTFVRNLQLLGEDDAEYDFANMDPGAAAIAMQQKSADHEAIVVWNPFVMETLNNRDDVKVLFDSTKIPNEIIDAVIVSQASLDKPGGQDFACAVIDAFYEVNQRIADAATSDEALVALGKKFSNLDLEAMKKVVQQTKFFSTPDAGVGILTGTEIKDIMTTVVDFCVKHEITAEAPKVGYGSKAEASDVALRFDPTYINLVKAKSN